MAEQVFGVTITNSAGRTVPVRLIGEQHVLDDLGHIPSFADWARAIEPARWMVRVSPRAPSTQSASSAGASTIAA